jgi:hypothetical protein
MARQQWPKFKSLHEERAFWDTHDAFEVLGEDGWEVIEAGTTQVQSFYIVEVGKRGAVLRLPRELLSGIGVRAGAKVRAWTQGKRLIIEAESPSSR